METKLIENKEKLPSKFKNIALLSEKHNVPEMLLIDENKLDVLFTDFKRIQSEIISIENSISITSGAFIDKDFERIQGIINQLAWDENIDSMLQAMIDSIAKKEEFDVAVRSACLAEDMQNQSFAGIYESVLNVKSIEYLKKSILTVYNSFYSFSAILERRQSESNVSENKVFIILQNMVNPSFSGVAFSRHPLNDRDEAYIEYVEGLGEGLVSGQKVSQQLLSDAKSNDKRIAWKQISSMLNSAKELLKQDVDIEWAFESGETWLLQVRPITSKSKNENEGRVVGELGIWPLYDELPSSLKNSLPDYAIYFNKKRKPLIDIASQYQEKQPKSIILRTNKKHFERKELRKELEEGFVSNQVVLDFSKSMRQLVIDKKDLIEKIERMITDDNHTYTIVIRDFIKGDYGLITRKINVNDTVKLVAEISEDGLLGINRGSASSKLIVIEENLKCELLNAKQIKQLANVTNEAVVRLGDSQIEWVLSNNDLFALDYSLVEKNNLKLTDDSRIMSEGYARGSIFMIQDTIEMEDYSVAPSMSLTEVPDSSEYGHLFSSIVTDISKQASNPIIKARRPYAALASLIPFASGFIFEDGSLLCHLGVLLREKRIPAICDEKIFMQVDHGDMYELNTNAED